MDTRPSGKKYRGLISAAVIEIIAIIILIVGLVIMGLGIFSGWLILGLSGIYIGIGCIISSAFLFIPAHIAEELHYQSFLKEYYGEEAVNYHRQSLQNLQSIEFMLQRHFYPQQAPYAPVPSTRIPESQYMPPQQCYQPDVLEDEYQGQAQTGQQKGPKVNSYMETSRPQENEHQPRKQARYSGTTMKKRKTETPDDSPAEYNAQFKRPIQTGKPSFEHKVADIKENE